MNAVLLALAHGLMFGLVGVAVRSQLALFRGFDFAVAAYVLVAAEVFVTVGESLPPGGTVSLVVAFAAAVGASLVMAVGWNLLLAFLWPRDEELSAKLFVASLGLNSAVMGAVGAARGPGLRQISDGLGKSIVGANPVALGVVVGALAAVGIVVVGRSRAGLGLELFSQNRSFALELGVRRDRLLVIGALVSGSVAGVVGAYQGLTNGSRPELGMLMFLYGAAAALLFGSKSLVSPVVGGVSLGAASIGLQLIVSPTAATFVLFAIVAVLLVVRGSARVLEGLR